MLQPKHILKPQHLSLLEAPPRFELGNKGFADLCLTTWLWRRIYYILYDADMIQITKDA